MKTKIDARTDDIADLFRALLETINGHEMESIRLALAMAFAASLTRSAVPLPVALDRFTADATAFYYRAPKQAVQ